VPPGVVGAQSPAAAAQLPLGRWSRLHPCSMNRAVLALGSYLALFILAPLVACFLILGASARAAGYCVPIFVVLCLIGERGYRRWKRLWRVE